MKSFKRKLAALAAAFGALMMNAPAVLAQSDYGLDYSYEYNTTGDDWVGLLICGCVCLLVALILGFRIWMLVHAIKNAPESEKTLWIILILLVPVGSLIYFFTKKKEWDGGSESLSAEESEESSPEQKEEQK
jgi:hypothetical protein